MITIRKSIPVCSSSIPIVNRLTPDCPSIPTVAIDNPTTIAMNPLSMLPLDMDAVMESAATISRKYSAGPNLSANRDTGVASMTIKIAAMVPPIKDAMAEIARADSAFPFFAMG